MRWKARPPHRRPHGRRLLLLLAVGAAVLIGVPARREGSDRDAQSAPASWPGGRIRAEGAFGLCHEGGGRNCVVDGDTVWIAGEKVRIAGIDAPETHEFQCPEEAALGRRAALRLQALLNGGPLTATAADRNRDPNGRQLRNIAVNGRDVGKTLVAEGLVREYGGRKKGWCG